jgi:nicotinate-nucleotide adenylyltransferase
VRLGVLGGTFDPPHVGHLLAASDAFEALALDRLLFIPAASHPFKGESVGATP